MKATLKFNLPEEEIEFNDARNGTAWRGVVHNLFEKIRRIDKVGQSSITMENLREFLNDELENKGLDLYSA